MNLRISVYAEGEYWSGGVEIIVPEPMLFAFEPLKTCSDDALLALITGDKPINSVFVEKKLKTRTDAAEYLSKAIARHLLAEMGKKDTHNGYKSSGRADERNKSVCQREG